MAVQFDLLKHYPDRWAKLKEIQAIADTDVLTCTPPEELVGVVPTYYVGFTCEKLEGLTYGEMSKYSYGELASDERLCNVHTLQHLHACMEQELNNSLIIPYGDSPGADEYTISRWEKMLGINPDAEATLDDRIFVINIKLFQTAPYTIKKVQHMLDSLLGVGEIKVDQDVENKIFKATLQLSSRFKKESMREMLDNMIPANMELIVDVAYTTHDQLDKYTHDDLSQYTHDKIVITEL